MYEWAANKTKLFLAQQDAGKDASEEQVKDAYIKRAGLVIASVGTQVDTLVETTEGSTDPEGVEPKAPKKTSKKVAKKSSKK